MRVMSGEVAKPVLVRRRFSLLLIIPSKMTAEEIAQALDTTLREH